MTARPNRMRPRFSLLSALMMFAALSSVLVLNTIPRLGTIETCPEETHKRGGEGGYYIACTEHRHGWPWTYRTELASSVPNDAVYQAGLSWSALAFNTATGLGIALVVAMSTELLLRVLRRR